MITRSSVAVCGPQRMFLAEKTVKNYVSSLLTKLGMQRRTQAAAFVARHADHPDD